MSIVKSKTVITISIFALLIAAYYLFTQVDENNINHKEKVTIGMVTFPGYAPLYLAKEKDLFDGIDVRLVRIEAIGDLRAAINSGNIDMYIATPDIFQSTGAQEPPGIGFLAIDESSGADGIAVLNEVNSMSDLKGKKLGAEPGLPPYFILQYMLNAAGMTLSDIDFRDISSQDAGNAFVVGKLDAAGTYEPYLSKSVELRKDAKILVSSANLKGLIVDIIFANETFLKNNPNTITAVVDGWFKALEYYHAHKDESIEIMAKSFGVSKEEMVEIKSGISWLNKSDNHKLFDFNEESNLYQTFDLVGDVLVKNDSNGHRVYAKDKLTDQFVR